MGPRRRNGEQARVPICLTATICLVSLWIALCTVLNLPVASFANSVYQYTGWRDHRLVSGTVLVGLASVQGWKIPRMGGNLWTFAENQKICGIFAANWEKT